MWRARFCCGATAYPVGPRRFQVALPRFSDWRIVLDRYLDLIYNLGRSSPLTIHVSGPSVGFSLSFFTFLSVALVTWPVLFLFGQFPL
jgi:hypothetical protein